jgi:hypothetical protein
MNEYTYQTTLPWKLTETNETTSNATVTIYRVGYQVNMNIISEEYVASNGVKGRQSLTIPSVPTFLHPSTGVLSFSITHTFTMNDPILDREYDERAFLEISGSNLILTVDIGPINIGTDHIHPINLVYLCTITGPTGDVAPYGATGASCSLGPITQLVSPTYFLAVRSNTTNINISNNLPGTLVPFPTIQINQALTSSWSLGVDQSTITVPLTGIYQYLYTITVHNNSGNIRTVSSCLMINDTISSGGGSTIKMDKSSIGMLVGQQILQLNQGSQLKVHVVGTGGDIVITGTASLFITDNTSTTIAIVKIA